MSKIILRAIVVASAFSLGACGGGLASRPPAVPASAPASVSTVSTTPSTADATVVCKDGKKGVAKAVGNGVRAVASCDGDKKKPKVVAKKAVAKKVMHREMHSQDNADVIRSLAMANVELKTKGSSGSSAVAFTGGSSMTRFPVEGKVYSDAEGNTFERHQGGTRECKFYVNGELVKRMFVQNPDRHESKRQCDLLSQEFYSTMSATTPENGTSKKVSKETSYEMPRGNAHSSVISSASSSASSVVATSNGSHTCVLKFNGKVVETTKTIDDAACKVWTDGKARSNGWIAK